MGLANTVYGSELACWVWKNERVLVMYTLCWESSATTYLSLSARLSDRFLLHDFMCVCGCVFEKTHLTFNRSLFLFFPPSLAPLSYLRWKTCSTMYRRGGKR